MKILIFVQRTISPEGFSERLLLQPPHFQKLFLAASFIIDAQHSRLLPRDRFQDLLVFQSCLIKTANFRRLRFISSFHILPVLHQILINVKYTAKTVPAYLIQYFPSRFQTSSNVDFKNTWNMGILKPGKLLIRNHKNVSQQHVSIRRMKPLSEIFLITFRFL